ncbi:putative lipoprotein [Mycobacterium talmoniae]|uniref:Putative lipoprotein n=1 Tax=Mycobacterium talmoniae TaxID=1858794 RepID=A0A2S8BEU7_9MYCO|nr:putative lipoprotein [Mycobacterium talmoniae]
MVGHIWRWRYDQFGWTSRSTQLQEQRLLKWGAAVPLLALAAIAGPAMTGCAGSANDQIDYAVDGALVTYNTTTVTGAASAGSQAFARTLTGFGYHGPDGQVIADQDFGTIKVVGRAPLVLDYQIADKAVYSDGKPVTCDDMVLAWAAQSGRFGQFNAANQAGYTDIASIDCPPGQKKARVSFAQDRNFVDYKQLFTATSMMPAHVIAEELGINTTAVTDALQSTNMSVVDKVAQVWNSTWQLKPDIDTKHFPSSGPYKIDSVLDGGAVVLVANDRWWGAKPVTKRITVWPQGADIQDRVNKRAVDVVEGDGGRHIEPLRRRVVLAELQRQGHREARGMRRGGQFLRAGLAARLFGAGRPGHLQAVEGSAAPLTQRARARGQWPFPGGLGGPLRNAHPNRLLCRGSTGRCIYTISTWANPRPWSRA